MKFTEQAQVISKTSHLHRGRTHLQQNLRILYLFFEGRITEESTLTSFFGNESRQFPFPEVQQAYCFTSIWLLTILTLHEMVLKPQFKYQSFMCCNFSVCFHCHDLPTQTFILSSPKWPNATEMSYIQFQPLKNYNIAMFFIFNRYLLFHGLLNLTNSYTKTPDNQLSTNSEIIP